MRKYCVWLDADEKLTADGLVGLDDITRRIASLTVDGFSCFSTLLLALVDTPATDRPALFFERSLSGSTSEKVKVETAEDGTISLEWLYLGDNTIPADRCRAKVFVGENPDFLNHGWCVIPLPDKREKYCRVG